VDGYVVLLYVLGMVDGAAAAAAAEDDGSQYDFSDDEEMDIDVPSVLANT
jgi:hypothetical protein